MGPDEARVAAAVHYRGRLVDGPFRPVVPLIIRVGRRRALKATPGPGPGPSDS